ncbi:MAG: phosphoribosylamine--glycine ligase [Alphaproteobacteria bacterium]|nr:phosphoribosylamine--glycine ligase [Alphaproteobacteria bacterium]
MTKRMTVLLLGSGGREHALAWKMAQSPLVEKIHVLPGNPGMPTKDGRIVCIEGEIDAAARELKPDLTVIGPEKPMAEGVTDRLEAAGFTVLGASKDAARLESSKIFSKEFMGEEGIPTARAVRCDGYAAAVAALATWDVEGKGVVIKADGLAAGKGVIVTSNRAEAGQALHDFMVDGAHPVKAERVLLEETLHGREVSAFALCDGERFIPFGYICDHKRAFDGDKGPNTGGMGAFSSKDWPSEAARAFINEHIFAATLRGMQKRGAPFKGVLFAGLMIDGDDVKVIEFNVRLGDPEAQALLPLIESDIVPPFLAAARGDLSACAAPKIAGETAVHVVMASAGYPSPDMKLGEKIALAPVMNDTAQVFFAGVKDKDGALVSSGGRVLGVTARGATLAAARQQAYALLENISFSGAHWRRDIGRQ